jgi:hypothetical protein
VFENRVLRRIFGPKRVEVVGGCRRLHNEEFHNLYPSSYVVKVIKLRRMSWAGYIARIVGNPEGKRPFGGSRRRWEDKRLDHKDIDRECVCIWT